MIEKVHFIYHTAFPTLKTFCARNDIPLQDAEFQRIYQQWRSHKTNVMLASRLIDLYTQLHIEAVSIDPEAKFLHLLRLFKTLFPEETKQIHEFIDVFGFSNSNTSTIMKGGIQSGKTLIMILGTLCYLSCNRDVIVVVRNKLDDKHQFIDRFNQVVQTLTDHGYVHPNFVIVEASSPPSHPCVFVEIFHKGNLSRIYDSALRQRDTSKTVLYIDEADLRDEYSADLFRCVGKTIYVSATVQDLLIQKWNVRVNHVISLRPKSIYKGVETLTFITNREMDTVDDLFYSLCDIAVDSHSHPTHPKIVLINATHLRKEIDSMCTQLQSGEFVLDDNIRARLPNEMANRCIICYTGDGITVTHPSLRDIPNGIPKMTSIRTTFEWLYQNGGKDRFPNIIVVAGGMADRGINFADHKTSGWHITSQVLIKPSSSCANLLQSLRILGVHNDDIPLKVYTTPDVKNRILKGFRLTETIVNQLQETKMPDEMVDRVCREEVVIRKQDIPAKYLTKGTITKSFRVVTTREENDGNILVVIPSQLAPCEYAVYEHVMPYLRNCPNVWIQRSEIVNHIQVDRAVAEARMKDMCLKPNRHTRTNDDACLGLLFKKQGNLWLVRLNQV